MSRAQAEALLGAFAEFGPVLREHALADFSGLRAGAQWYCEVAPRTAAAAARVVRVAHARGVPLRMRAQGHSLNGASLPRDGELLLATRHLRHVRFEEPGTVTAGGGAVLWILQHALRRRGFDLPVVNDGYAGPSVGGYLAAGGFGPRSAQHGGYWDNVLAVRWLDGRGELRELGPGDARFAWLFGAMGQLGLCCEAKLAIVPLDAAAPPAYPAGASLTVPELVQPRVPPEFATEGDESLFWFTLFVPDEELDAAHAGLAALERRHGGALRFQQRYNYPIRPRGRVAPLVYPQSRPITATGAWGWLRDKSPAGTERLFAFDAEFMALAGSRPQYRRYVQSELPAGPEVFERCFGPAVYGELRRLKAELDPGALFNRGSVFAER